MRTCPRRAAFSLLAFLLAFGGAATVRAPSALATSGATRAEAAAFARALTGTGASVGAEVVGEDGATLAAVSPAAALPPASTQKIATIGTALTVLGPAHRFSTVLRGTAAMPRRSTWKGVVPDVYAGSLLVVAGGDPSLRMDALPALFAPVLSRGIGTVTGGLWLDASLFDAVRGAPGWRSEWLGTEVGPLSAFMLEENLTRADPEYLADPDTGNLQVLQRWLAQRGVTVLGGLHVGRPPTDAGVLLATVRSRTLTELAAVTLRDSVNTWAEVLLKDVGASRGAGTTARGLQIEHGVLAADGAPADTASDGSGLSLLDRASAHQETAIVRALAGSSVGPALLSDLPVSCAQGTLVHRLCAVAGRVHAKTGTLDTVAALTGYVVDRAGSRLWFSVQVGAGASPGTRVAWIDRAVLALAGG